MSTPASTQIRLKHRIQMLLNSLNADLFEKAHIMRLALLSSLAGESIFLLGPPGVAKSMIARRLKHAFTGAKSFEYLMGKFSTPDEVFGPVSIKKLKEQDKYERLTEHYLPGAHIVFLDEIWKASPPIQNALLTVLNEKVYRNGELEQKVDIRGLLAASNELPVAGEGLEAIYDRFLIRVMVENIQQDGQFLQLLQVAGTKSNGLQISESIQISEQEYEQWDQAIGQIGVPSHVLSLILHLRKSIHVRNEGLELEDQLYVSDRRWVKITRLLKTSAFLNDLPEVHLIDLHLASHCIWHRADQIAEAKELVEAALAQYGYRGLVPIRAMEQELSSLKEEILQSTQQVRQERVEVPKTYEDSRGEAYLRIPMLWNRGAVFIRRADFDKLGEQQMFIPIFEQTAEGYRTFQRYGFSKVSPFELLAKDKQARIETEHIDQEKVDVLRPEANHLRLWNNQIDLLLESCDRAIEMIQAKKEQEEPLLTQHLFVDPAVAPLILDNLDRLTNDLLNLKLDIQKTRHSYESLGEH
ncbi:AAA family ATPase [Pontibacter sp. G13]|uniref:AAA family ATPase n=1 Tax=Pontibacter sp. G13 TaxID=3074898 RepID=UPI00288BD855|nr:AAA family ATPase [Pontibacter sp. G13]WNJ21263.1 AAA family ATPase [Pontibacter sp. G13]